MAKNLKKTVRKKIRELGKDGRISKKDTRKIAKISGGELSNKKLNRMLGSYSKKNDVKIRTKNTVGLLEKFNVARNSGGTGTGSGSVPGSGSGSDNRFNNLMGKIDDFKASTQAAIDDMFAGQDERDAELQRLEEERLKEFELNQRTMLGNEARSGQQATYRLGGAAGRMKGGTSGFKRRNLKKSSRIMSGISAGTVGMLNV